MSKAAKGSLGRKPLWEESVKHSNSRQVEECLLVFTANRNSSSALGASCDPEDRVNSVCGFIHIYLCIYFFGLGHRGTQMAVVPDATVHTVCPAGFCCTLLPVLMHGLLPGDCTRLFPLWPEGDSVQSIAPRRVRGHSS